MAKDRTPDPRRSGGGSSRDARGGASARGSSAAGRPGAKGRTRPPTQVVTQQRRPWGLIAAAVAVVVFAVGAIGFALAAVNEADRNAIESPEEIDGVEIYEYEAGEHVVEDVQYTESPPVGGPHADSPMWADCTGTVYDVDIRHENAVHSLEHGAVWITYNPDEVSEADVDTLAGLVENQPGRMLSPIEGQESPISLQSWNHQLKVDAADDPRVQQYVDYFTLNPKHHPEPGASCSNQQFLDNPPVEEADGEAPADETPAPSSAATEPSEPAEPSETATQ